MSGRGSFLDEGDLPEVGDRVYVFGGMGDDEDGFVGPVLDVEPNWPQVQILDPAGGQLWYELDGVYPEDGTC